jgi:hypothetical protein
LSKLRILVYLSTYPTLSQTYKENELRALLPYCELRILSIGGSDHPYRDHLPYVVVESPEQLSREARAFRPDLVHGHYVHLAGKVRGIARGVDCPFTIRTHSFDVMGPRPEALQRFAPIANHSDCAGVLCFPFLRNRLLAAGVADDKLHDCWPVVDFDRFYDPSPNGEEVMNTGACLPKKNMESFVRLAQMVPERQFNLYPIGYFTNKLDAFNRKLGAPVRVHQVVEPGNMPLIYKRHQWLVYSANHKIPTVGWPMAIAEAQAAGVGVLIQRIRPDIATFVGGGGFTFDSLQEAAEIVRGSCPQSVREAGFRQAKKSDVRDHIALLLRLWARAGRAPTFLPPPTAPATRPALPRM